MIITANSFAHYSEVKQEKVEYRTPIVAGHPSVTTK